MSKINKGNKIMKLIDKDKIVAEIERRRDFIYKRNPLLINSEYCIEEDNAILKFLDTLEVKEVDLDKEIDRYYNIEASKEFEDVLYYDIEKFAKHFFELGLKAAQKGE